jgi:hypothetical protein
VSASTWVTYMTTTRSRATSWLLANERGRAGGEPAQGSSRSCRTKLDAGTISTTPGAGNVGPSCSSQNFPCAACVRRGRWSLLPPWRTTWSHIKAITSCSISGTYSPSASIVTATVRSSRKHTATNGTSGLTAGLPTRTIPRTSQALEGLANQGMVLEHVDGCLRVRGTHLFDLKSMRIHGRWGGGRQKIRVGRDVDRACNRASVLLRKH